MRWATRGVECIGDGIGSKPETPCLLGGLFSPSAIELHFDVLPETGSLRKLPPVQWR